MMNQTIHGSSIVSATNKWRLLVLALILSGGPKNAKNIHPDKVWAKSIAMNVLNGDEDDPLYEINKAITIYDEDFKNYHPAESWIKHNRLSIERIKFVADLRRQILVRLAEMDLNHCDLYFLVYINEWLAIVPSGPAIMDRVELNYYHILQCLTLSIDLPDLSDEPSDYVKLVEIQREIIYTASTRPAAVLQGGLFMKYVINNKSSAIITLLEIIRANPDRVIERQQALESWANFLTRYPARPVKKRKD